MLTMEKGFIEALLGSFFRWWWAVLTGFASILSWVYAPDGFTLTRMQVTSLTLFGLMLIFFVASTIYQGWRLYRNRLGASTVIGFQKSDNYGGEFVFIIEGVGRAAQGKVAELKRPINGVEVPFAIVEFIDVNARGNFQANPVWISPNHLRELRTGKFVFSDIVVDPLISLRTLQSARIGSTV